MSRSNNIDHQTTPEQQEQNLLAQGIRVARVEGILRQKLQKVREIRVTREDKIMQRGWDASPVVLESHKLIFFTIPKVGCTVWKSLFRRMMGFPDWKSASPHDPATNGLKYLRKFNLKQIQHMMNDPSWTRAIFVRDPKERFLSAWLEKAYGNKWHQYVPINCPRRSNLTAEVCVERSQTLEGFLNLTATVFPDSHWNPQNERMDPQHWKTINFVGHMESMEIDARSLLERIGAWKDYGATGWGTDGNQSVFSSTDQVLHKSGAQEKLARYYNTQQLQDLVDARYAGDYNLSMLGLTPIQIPLPIPQEEK